MWSFFWSVFSRIQTEYRNLQKTLRVFGKSPYLVRIREIQTRKKSVFGFVSHNDAYYLEGVDTFFHAPLRCLKKYMNA